MPLESINLAALNQQRRIGAADNMTDSAKGPKRTTKNMSSDDDFQATPEELENIKTKMNDPVFVKLMHEYMESLSDPETLKEEEEYLKQVEREAKEGGDYSFEFIFPQPVFVVELCNPTTRHACKTDIEKIKGKRTSTQKAVGRKIAELEEEEEVRHTKTEVKSYINFCVSEKVDEFHEESTHDKRASNWHVPVSVSEKRLEFYQPMLQEESKVQSKRAESKTATSAAADEVDTPLCYVYDAVYHPKTLQLANMSNKFLCFVVEIAVEHINSGYKERNGFEFTRLPSSITAIGKPHNQTVRIKNGKSPFEVDKSQPVLTQPQRIITDSTINKNDNDTDKGVKNTKNNTSTTNTKDKISTTLSPSSSSYSSSAKRSPLPEEEEEKAVNKEEQEVKFTQGNGEETTSQLPLFNITHRGYISMSDAWNEKVSDKRIGVPAELIVKIHFAPMISASALDVQITDDGSAIQISRTPTQCNYHGLIVLPFTVEQEPIAAKLVKREGVLTLTLKVIPPLRSCDNNTVNIDKKEKVDSKTSCSSNTLTAESVREQLGLTCVKSKHINKVEAKTENAEDKPFEIKDNIAARTCIDDSVDNTIEVNTDQEKCKVDNIEKEINTLCVDNSDNHSNKATGDNNIINNVNVNVSNNEQVKVEPNTELSNTSEESIITNKIYNPHLLCGDAARNQAMLEKVQAARRARLAAEHNNSNNDSVETSETVSTTTTTTTTDATTKEKTECISNDNKQVHNGDNDDDKTFDNANDDDVAIISLQQEEYKQRDHKITSSHNVKMSNYGASTENCEKCVEHNERNNIKKEEIEELYARQDAWHAAVQEQMQKQQKQWEEHHEIQEDHYENDEEIRLAEERELTHRIAQQQEMLMRQQEEREAKLRSKMHDLPLSNAFIFSID